MRPRRSSSWRLRSRCWQRFIPRGAQPGSIRSRRSAMNELIAPAAMAEHFAQPKTSHDAPLLYLRGINRHYGQGETILEILRNAELALWPGQSIALVAPSGAGKSTLLHIAGLLEQ